MNIKEQTDKEIYWVLKEIQKLVYVTPERENLDFAINFEKNDDIPSPDNQRKILRRIEELGAIKIIDTTTISPMVDSTLLHTFYGLQPKRYGLTPIQPQLGKLLKQYEAANQKSNTVEFHYSQKIIAIIFADKSYVPRKQEIKEILRETAEHYGSSTRSKKLLRVRYLIGEIPSLNKERLRDDIFPNINRQLADKGIPVRFVINGEGVIIKKGQSEIKLEFL